MTDTQDDYIQLILASEAELSLSGASPEQLKLIKDNLITYLEILKMKKNDVEYQFASHNVIATELSIQYRSKVIDLNMYQEAYLNEKIWKAKAISYLTRIENKIIETKTKIKWQSSQSAIDSSQN